MRYEIELKRFPHQDEKEALHFWKQRVLLWKLDTIKKLQKQLANPKIKFREPINYRKILEEYLEALKP